ncbi:hypothetical protein ADL26_07915 [Thermoactinomyces vulgaris]|nr:hypothetical protein ADL26_07915 [Thermoactinomyces vulgaris]
MSMSTLQHSLIDLAEDFLANVQDELVASAAAGEAGVTAAIEDCIAYHRGRSCEAYPHACPDVHTAVVAADAAAEVVVAWLVATGVATAEDDAALETVGHLIAEFVATQTARLEL